MKRPDYARFNGMEQGPDFDRALELIATPFQYVDIALDTAATNQIFDVSGDFLYFDTVTNGSATLELNNQYNDPAAPFSVQAGFAINALFKQIKLSWTSQPGKKLRVMYSTGDRVVPTNSTSISGTIQNDPPRSSWTNTQKTVTTTAAQLVASNANRKYLLIQNKDASGSIYVTFNATATVANGVLIGPGASYELNSNVSTDSVSAIGSIASNANIVVVEG